MRFFNLHDHTFNSLTFLLCPLQNLQFCSNFIWVTKRAKNKSRLFKETTWVMPLKPPIHHLHVTDSPVIPIICRLVFHASSMYTSFLAVHCISSFLLVRAVDQKRRQLTVRFYSRWYIIRTGVGVLAKKIKLTTVKPVLMTTFLKQPPVLNDHAVVLP